MNWKGCAKKWVWPNLTHYPKIGLDGLRRTMTNLVRIITLAEIWTLLSPKYKSKHYCLSQTVGFSTFHFPLKEISIFCILFIDVIRQDLHTLTLNGGRVLLTSEIHTASVSSIWITRGPVAWSSYPASQKQLCEYISNVMILMSAGKSWEAHIQLADRVLPKAESQYEIL
jgi:hypothetical protein